MGVGGAGLSLGAPGAIPYLMGGAALGRGINTTLNSNFVKNRMLGKPLGLIGNVADDSLSFIPAATGAAAGLLNY